MGEASAHEIRPVIIRMSHQADSLYRKIMRSCASPEQRAAIIAAFALAEAETGSQNAIGNLEAICIEYAASASPRAAARAKLALREQKAREA